MRLTHIAVAVQYRNVANGSQYHTINRAKHQKQQQRRVVSVKGIKMPFDAYTHKIGGYSLLQQLNMVTPIYVSLLTTYHTATHMISIYCGFAINVIDHTKVYFSYAARLMN